MIFTRDEILSSPEYWFEEAQNELYAQVVTYMEQEGLNQSQLAERLKVSRGYISQVMKGEFNYTLKKLIELSLAVGKVPRIEYKSIAQVLEEDKENKKRLVAEALREVEKNGKVKKGRSIPFKKKTERARKNFD